MKKPRQRDLSELEGAVLGIVRKNSPCTAYAVRKNFWSSPAHHWKASAGAIYPVMERLEAAGLLAAVESQRGRQSRRQYTLTRTGQTELRRWLCEASAQLVVPPDPLRTRLFFFDLLEPQERKSVLDQAQELIATQLPALEQDCRDRQKLDEFGHLAARGALLVAKARLKWISRISKQVEREIDPTE